MPQRKLVDPSSPEYRKAAGKYMRFMIAMPIFLVTSWALFNRLVLGDQAKQLQVKISDAPGTEETKR